MENNMYKLEDSAENTRYFVHCDEDSLEFFKKLCLDVFSICVDTIITQTTETQYKRNTLIIKSHQFEEVLLDYSDKFDILIKN